MKYTAANEILPKELLKQVQKYIQGQYIYIPKEEGVRNPWGSNSGAKRVTAERHSEIKEKFLNVIPKEDIIYQDKCTKILYKNDLIDYPFQTNIHQLEKQEFIDCLYDLFNKEEKDKYDNFLDMLYGKFGKSITEKFLKPYNEKLYAVDLKELDVDAMGRFFPYANIKDIINNMKEDK